MKKPKILALALAAFALVLALGGCEEKQDEESGVPKTVRIAYLPLTHALALLAAKELAEQGKIEKRVNIELVKFGSWPELTDALNAGRVDGASILIELALKSKERGIELKAVSLGHHDGNVVVARPEIGRAEDFRGKSFAIPHRLSSHNILLQRMLGNAGMNLADVKLLEMSPPEMPSALAQGRIDGYCAAEPFGAKALTLGVGKMLFGPDDLWKDSFCCGLVLNDSFIAAHPGTATELAAQYEQAGEFLAADPEAAFRVAAKYLRVDHDTLKLSLDWISFGDLKISRKTYDTLVERMQEAGLTRNPPSYEDFVAKLSSEP
ncbi:MAG: ABC transporter substrate-binding protein [Betaproteobacteria bacterium]|nr:ABC transporter substrate-binding protein [Betaproteobacteria bacterium]